MDRIRDVEQELLRTFRAASDKEEAHAGSRPLLEQLSREPAFLTQVLEKYVLTPGALAKKNYPVVSMEIALNPWFSLVANCWIPMVSRETHVATKAIHHHGPLLLSTVTAFGPGYEHWMFSLPRPIDGSRGLYAMDLLEAAPHPRHHVSFVDKWTAHTPLFPAALSITFALWSNSKPTTWRDRLKRIPLLKGREARLRELALSLGLRRGLDLKVVEDYDYFPVRDGFEVMPVRKEFERGPVEDHLCSVFNVMQETGNERLARTVRRAIDLGKVSPHPKLAELLERLEGGAPIEGRLSAGHTDLPYANFTRAQIEQSLAAVKTTNTTAKGGTHGGKFATEAHR